MDLRHLGAVRERLAITGNTGFVSLDHHRIREDRSNEATVLTDGDNLSGLISSELRERQPIRHFQGVLILRKNGPAAHNGEHSRDSRNRPYSFALPRTPSSNLVPIISGWMRALRPCRPPTARNHQTLRRLRDLVAQNITKQVNTGEGPQPVLGAGALPLDVLEQRIDITKILIIWLPV
jgi:hypothetical protein